jgi:Domain of unknown function (DUF4440)
VANLVTASDKLASISQHENTLAKAVKSKNKAVLATLTDKDFHVYWSQGTVIRSLETDVNRQDWIDDLSHLRVESYEIEISKVQWADSRGRNQPPLGAYVTLTEFWTVVSAGGRRIDKRVESLDLWVRQSGGWKLASRVSRSR